MTLVARTRSHFFGWMGLALALVIVAGFARTFYLRAWFDVPPLAALLYLHGVLFSAWVALFLFQATMVARGELATHRRYGRIGIVLLPLLVAVGLMATVASAATPKPHVWGFTSAQFSLIPLVEVAGFAGFVAAALLRRGQPAAHRRFMLLAMITAIPPATARLITLAGLNEHYLALQVAATAGLLGCMAIEDWRQLHRVHRITITWGALLVASWPLRMWIAGSAAWAPVGRWIASLAGGA